MHWLTICGGLKSLIHRQIHKTFIEIKEKCILTLQWMTFVIHLGIISFLVYILWIISIKNEWKNLYYSFWRLFLLREEMKFNENHFADNYNEIWSALNIFYCRQYRRNGSICSTPDLMDRLHKAWSWLISTHNHRSDRWWDCFQGGLVRRNGRITDNSVSVPRSFTT